MAIFNARIKLNEPFVKAYPEYLVSYLIVKPEPRADDEISVSTP